MKPRALWIAGCLVLCGGVVSAHVRIPRANHDVFLSNEADVLRDMAAFPRKFEVTARLT